MTQIPYQIKKVKESADYAQLVIGPLAQGYGQTLGNALRRVMLTSLTGAAITQVKISGIKHKFSTLTGLKEDIIELLLNLKQVRFQYSGEKPIKIKLEKTGPAEVKAKDIQAPAQLKIINPDLVLAHLANRESKLKMELQVERGTGYWLTEENHSEKLGVIFLDAIFSPVIRVNYKVEETRVGQRTDFDSLIMEIYTDGTTKPVEALKEAAKILIDLFTQIIQPKKMITEPVKTDRVGEDLSKLTVEELEIPTRIANALKKAGYETVADLKKASLTDLTKIKNLGGKSLEIIKAVLEKKGLKFS